MPFTLNVELRCMVGIPLCNIMVIIIVSIVVTPPASVYSRETLGSSILTPYGVEAGVCTKLPQT